jgi:hypothetical protein
MDGGSIRDVRFLAVTTLDSDATTPGIQPYDTNDTDLEDIQLVGNELLISSERDKNGRPWIRRFALDGTLLGELPIPDRFVTVTEQGPDGRPRVVRGVRTNLGHEGMTLTPDGLTLYTANEEALAQDGPIATLTGGTNVRVTRWQMSGREARPTSEYVYAAEKVFAEPQPADQFADNGVTSLLWVRHLLPDYDMLVLERSFATGVGNDVSIFGVTLAEATDVSSLDALPSPFGGRVVRKTRLAAASRTDRTRVKRHRGPCWWPRRSGARFVRIESQKRLALVHGGLHRQRLAVREAQAQVLQIARGRLDLEAVQPAPVHRAAAVVVDRPIHLRRFVVGRHEDTPVGQCEPALPRAC